MTISAWNNKLASSLFLVAGLLINMIAEAATIELNKINSCSTVSAMLRDLKNAPSCRSAQGIIETKIRDRINQSRADFCALQNPQSQILIDFNCFKVSSTLGNSITCYKPISAESISDYKNQFKISYRTQAASYLEAAARCPGSNGEASHTSAELMPIILMSIARHEFGFAVQYGKTANGRLFAQHGFATLSPELSKSGSSAIEYVSFAEGVLVSTQRKTIGNWSIQNDDAKELSNTFYESYKKQGIETYPMVFIIDILRSPLAKPRAKQHSLMRELSRHTISQLEDEGFDEMSDTDFERNTGINKEDLSRKIHKEWLFGMPKTFQRNDLQLRILTKNSALPCTKNRLGAIGAYIITQEGSSTEEADFGDITLFLVGFGTCAKSANGKSYINNLTNEANSEILDYLTEK